jgi:hypothetical protein
MKTPKEGDAETMMLGILIFIGIIFLLWIAGQAGWLMAIKPYFDDYGSIFSGVSYLAVIFGLYLTFNQIKSAKKQIRANFSYRIHKDGRNIRNSIDDEIVKIIESPISCKTTEEEKSKATKAIRETLMYYSAVYHQYEYGNIDESEWKLLEDQFFSFLENDMVTGNWNENIAENKRWHKGLRSLGNEFIKKGG